MVGGRVCSALHNKYEVEWSREEPGEPELQSIWGPRTVRVWTLREYVRRAELEGAYPAMFSLTHKPHERESQETPTRYMRNTLQEAGIYSDVFTPYSCRHPTTSTAVKRNVRMAMVLQSAGSSGDSTFQRFYNRPTCTRRDPHKLDTCHLGCEHGTEAIWTLIHTAYTVLARGVIQYP